MKKLYWAVLVLMMLILVFPVAAAVNVNTGADAVIPDKTALYGRVIAEHPSKEAIKSFESKGCFVRHKLRDAASFDCPKNIISQLGVRESRVFRIMDIDADKQIGADKVWAEGADGSGVKVAILDTGIDTDHPELQDSYLGGYDYVNNDPYPEDDNGHGTHVAGIITANGISDAGSKGVAPGAGIYMYKVCDSGGSCYEDDMIAAMEAAVQAGTNVMSISIGGGSYTTENCDSDSLAAKVNWVVSQGLTAVVAAGNDGKGVSTPGCASKAIAVGAVDKTNNVPYWSGRGKALDIVAPGASIYSTLIGGYGSMSGTSMATPHVSGVVALLLDVNSGLTTQEIKTALNNTASPVSKCYRCALWFGSNCFRQSAVTCTRDITGAGIVNSYSAYLAVKPAAGCSSDADCNDNVGCTADSCSTANGMCVYAPSDNICPADGWADTGKTKWVSASQCTEKEQKEQEYRNYYCDPALDCRYNATNAQWIDTGAERNKADGTSCDDGFYCNTGEACQAGVCTGGSVRPCDDGNACTSDSCDESADNCASTPVADGTPCDNGQFCTTNNVCTAGTCSGTARDCSDGIACTADRCDEINDACVNGPDNSFCSDGLFCNGAETCSALSGCQAGTPAACNDNNGCTADSCNENTDKCDYAWPACGSSDGCCSPVCKGVQGDPNYDPDCITALKCWSAQYQYLYMNSNQEKKFCKCTMGTYGYNTYKYAFKRATTYYYVDSGDNNNWNISSRSSYYTVYQVTCKDGKAYLTNQDYYRG